MPRLLTIALCIFLFTININAKKIGHENKRKLIIGYMGGPSSIDYWNKIRKSLLENSRNENIMLVDFSYEEFTQDKHIKSLTKASQSNIDGMIIGASYTVTDSIEEFRKRKIPVIALNNIIPNDWVSTAILSDDLKATKIASKFILGKLQKIHLRNNDDKVIILCGGASPEIRRNIRGEVSSDLISKAGYKVSIYYSKQWMAKDSLTYAIQEFSQNGKNIVASFSCYADATIASVLGAEELGFRPVQVGFDMDENISNMIREGRLDATIMQDTEQIGKITIQSIVNILKKDITLPKIVLIPPLLITQDRLNKKL